MAAIALNGGHVSRALDFYNVEGKYLAIGGTTPWNSSDEGDSNPDTPSPEDYKMNGVIALKKVSDTRMVIPVDPSDQSEGLISYRGQKWKKVVAEIKVSNSQRIALGDTTIELYTIGALRIGDKIRIANTYEAKITGITQSTITVDTPAPSIIAKDSQILGGALIEGAKYVYVEAYFEYDEIPLTTYRQIGLFTHVKPDTKDILLSAEFSTTNQDEYTDLGILEVIDNRIPDTRDINKRELCSMIVEF